MLDKIFDHKQIEKNHYQKWEESGLFECHPQMDTSPFTIMMPPPNVTGTLHMGHAFTNTLQDVMTRYNRMKGKDALWMPGTDHAGIATQMVVERKLAEEGQPSRRDMGREAFLEKVWEWKEYSGGTITNQLRRLGSTPDWSRERFTMDDGLNKAVRKAFVELYRKGLIFKDNRLVNWDPKLLTAISDIEVVQKEVKGHMWYIRYPVEGEEERYITIATTRPETMLGDTAIVVNPEDERYKDLIGKVAVLPIVGRLIKIIADDYVHIELGTGAMKVTPAHDFNDFEIGRRHNLEMISIMNVHAKINENAPEEYQGLDRYDARKKILQELEAQDLLDRVENITHMIPYGDRSDLVIEPFLTEQWYCDAKTLAQPAIEAVETGKTVFVPKTWENTYFEWMRNIQPWCISRQLWWGHQIPAWYDEDGKVYVAETEEEAQREAGAGVKLTRDDDVLDTWFSSALWPFSTLGWPDQTPELAKYYPGDVLCTGFDIIFFWVARMMMMGIHFMGDVPFHTVYMHALVRDAKGQKMSKSRGNVIDPLDTIEKYGADALRFCLTAMAAQGRDIRLSDERIEGYRNFATKIWNATRYCEMNGCIPNADFKPENAKHTINQWIIGQVMEVQKSIDKNMEEYRFNDAAGAIYQFVWGTFCDWYLEFTKPLLAEGNTDDVLKQETRDTTGWVLDQILTLLNPFMPYITEELYESIAVRPKNSLLMGQAWPTYPESLFSEKSLAEIDWLTRLVTEIRSVRSDMNVPAGAKIKMMIKDASEQTKSRIAAYEEIIARMARIENISMTAEAPKGSIQTIVDEATIILPIAEIIDLDKERERLKKEIDRLEANINRIDQKLSDDKFVNNAPAEIIAEQKARKAENETVMKKLSQALKQLEAA
ncbi:MAG: valine--tRNA ligase [Alphaproteobacteria bacterium CG1_02_46_17]|nr:MAG: valine--tRNA ligase [Alphaproteobacteria bacterium CG1_02_46_17]